MRANQEFELIGSQQIERQSEESRALSFQPFATVLVYVLSDLVVLLISYALAFTHFGENALGASGDEVLALGIPLWLASRFVCGCYKVYVDLRPERELENVVVSTILAFGGMFVLGLASGSLPAWWVFLEWCAVTMVLEFGSRCALRRVYEKFWRSGVCRARVLLMSSPRFQFSRERGAVLKNRTGYEVVGVLAATEPGTKGSQVVPVLGDHDSLPEIIDLCGIEVVVLDSEAIKRVDIDQASIVSECRRAGANVVFYDGALSDFEADWGIANFKSTANGWNGARGARNVEFVLKRCIDLFFGVIGSALTLSITPIIACLIWFEDPGPVFHSREFVGQDGRIRYYLKFRTMLKNADDILDNDPELKAQFLDNHKLREDPRVLRSGRFLRKYSIDEFPQFFSLLTGKLTLVGPRVISEEEKCRYGTRLAKRLSVEPGITGLWQVTGRQTTTYEQRILMDMFYVEHWSIWLDLIIIAKTFKKIFRPEGAY